MPSGGGYEPDIWETRPSRSGRWSNVVALSRTLGEPVDAAGEEDDHPVAIVQAGRWEDKHIVLHDPDHEVAEVAAKRAILDDCEQVIHYGDDLGAMNLAEQVVRRMAEPMAGRPGYREEWRP